MLWFTFLLGGFPHCVVSIGVGLDCFARTHGARFFCSHDLGRHWHREIPAGSCTTMARRCFISFWLWRFKLLLHDSNAACFWFMLLVVASLIIDWTAVFDERRSTKKMERLAAMLLLYYYVR